MSGTNFPRRTFLKQFSSLALLSMGAHVLGSCAKENSPAFSGKVCVIGAGAAGLYAAYLLQLKGVQVEIWEASNSAFGRILSNTDRGFPIELGAEEIHGKNSILFEWLINSGASFSKLPELDDYIFLNGSLSALSSLDSDPELKTMRQLLKRIDEDTDLPDTDPLSWAKGNGLTPAYENLFNALVGNERGTSVSRLGLKAISEENRAWTSGEQSVFLTASDYRKLFMPVFEKVKSLISLNRPVRNIDYRNPQITLIDWDGNRAVFDKVLCTVPLAMLKQSKPAFNPALPKDKAQAIARLGMDAGMKVVLFFRERFWPEDMGSLFGHPLVPEFWSPATVPASGPFVLTAFICGEAAENLQGSGNGAVADIIQGLDSMFNSKASAEFISYLIQNWKEQAWIGGAYSYATKSSSGDRLALAAPVENRIFFAGEATHTEGHNSTVHGAIETAVRAVHEILYS